MVLLIITLGRVGGGLIVYYGVRGDHCGDLLGLYTNGTM